MVIGRGNEFSLKMRDREIRKLGINYLSNSQSISSVCFSVDKSLRWIAFTPTENMLFSFLCQVLS